MKNEKTIEKRSARDFIYLTSCMLNAVAPDRSRLEAMDLSKVYRLAKRHMLASAIYLSLEQADCLMYMDKELAAEWRMYTDAVLRKNILMNVERKRILDRFESEGIWYALLKGCIIADYYPDFGMREMADNDILFDAAYQEKVHDIMVERGYRVTEYKVSNHDVYVKEPAYVFEMHKDLMSRPAFPELYVYFADIDDRLIRNADIPKNEIVLPDAKNDLVTDFNCYHGDIFLSNFRHKANHLAFMTMGEICYMIGVNAPDTFSRHYCDYTNDYLQKEIVQKLCRWESVYETMVTEAMYRKPDFGVVDNSWTHVVGPFNGKIAAVDLVVKNTDSTDTKITVSSTYGIGLNKTVY